MKTKPRKANPATASLPDTVVASNSVGMTKEILVKATAETIFQAISTANGLGKWWSYYTSAPDWENGEVLLKWPSAGHRARIRLSEAKAPTFAEWKVIEHKPFSEWNGTAIRFLIEEGGSGASKVVLRHIGLVPECECYEVCSSGWEYLVGQIKTLVEKGYT